jgi:tetratricopeptide (TPR) repeat protein
VHQKEWQVAIENYSNTIWYAPNNATLWLERGKLLLHLMCYESAIADFNECIALVPDKSVCITPTLFHALTYSKVYMLLGKCFLNIGNREQANEYFYKWLEFEPSKEVQIQKLLADAPGN